jgi:ribosome maturation factor RimP
VRDLAGPVAGRSGLVVEDVTVTPAGRRRVLRVVVDLPDDAAGSVSLDAVAEVSRQLSDALDASDVMGGTPYVLEVSSPGVDRPLTGRRHWTRARGRLVRVLDHSGADVTGRLAEVDDRGVVFDDGRRLAWDSVARGLVQVEFTRPRADEAEEG